MQLYVKPKNLGTFRQHEVQLLALPIRLLLPD